MKHSANFTRLTFALLKISIKGMLQSANTHGQNTITVDDKGIIVITIRGKQTRESMRALRPEYLTIAEKIKEKGSSVHIFVDMSRIKLRDISSESRQEVRLAMREAKYDRAVIYGNGTLLTLMMYLIRVASMGKRVQFFTNKSRALRWLTETSTASRPIPTLLAGIIIMIIGATALLGWQLNNHHLMSWITSLRPINPLAAVALIITGFATACYWADKIKVLRWSGLGALLLGIAALLPLHIDYILYGGRMTAYGAHVAIADSAAVCFIAMGIVGLVANRKQRWAHPLELICASALTAIALFNIFGQLYAKEALYSFTPNFVMAINLAVAFAIAGTVLFMTVYYRKSGKNVLLNISRAGWLIMSVLIIVQLVTYGVWSQSIANNKASAWNAFQTDARSVQDALHDRFAAYTNALYGFQGLFKASSNVSKGDFDAYYKTTNITEHYPGLRAFSFISKVTDAELPAYIQAEKTDTSVSPTGNPNFAIQNRTADKTHYILTYVANSPNSTALGTDFTSNPVRTKAYRQAEDSQAPAASGAIIFNGANGQKETGFFLSIPVSSAESSKTIGFVNAVFYYKEFFADTFKGMSISKDMSVKVTDNLDSKQVYDKPLPKGVKSDFVYSVPLAVANRTWTLEATAPQTFASTQSNLPLAVLAGGQAFSLLLIIIFWMQARGRRLALNLADAITHDLREERNRAVANDQKSTAILESIGDGVFAIDTKGVITVFNPAAQQISGVSADGAIGKPYTEVLHFELEKTGQRNDAFIRKALGGHVASMPVGMILVRQDGKRVPVSDSAAPIHNATGQMVGAIVVFRDTSKEHELDKAKNEFVSLASHQLRTPLSAINWYSEMLLSGDAGKLGKDQHEYINEISEGSKRMSELVNSLLNVSRLEVGKLTNEPAPNNVQELIADLKKEMQGQVEQRGVHVGEHIQKIPQVIADPKQLRMVIQNLLSNAVKYTSEKGTVEVTLRPATAADLQAAKLKGNGPYWFFSVQDNGYGIPQDQQSKIFGKLFRADNVRKLDVEGTGLGLYIVKEVVEKMGGRVWFTSTESVGTTFYVVAPIGTDKRIK